MDIENSAIAIDVDDIPELEPNEFHPMNDQFNQEIKHIKSMIMVHQRRMRRRHVTVAKLRFAGKSNEQIAQTTGYAAGTITSIMARSDTERLIRLLNYLETTMAGPTTAHRIAVLHRIVVRNEEKQPKIAIQAIAEINRMDKALMAANNPNSNQQPTQTVIVINQDQMPRTPLDQ